MKNSFLVALALLLMVLLMPATAQELKIERIPAGAENATGGTYCFGGFDAERVNALWHVVGSEWREALSAQENFAIRLPLNGKAREFVKNGIVYYKVMPGECLFVPEPIRANVDLVGLASNDKIAIQAGPAQPTPPAPSLWTDLATTIFYGAGILLMLYYFSKMITLIRRKRKLNEAKARADADWEFNNPSQSGPPVVEGGVGAVPQQERYSRIVAEFATTAAVSTHGTVPSEWRVIGDIVRGRLVNCEGMVRYREGTEPAMRHFTDEPAFRAMMEHTPTGERHQKYILWVCMNGCWLNMVEGTLNFVPDTNESTGEIVTLSPIVLAEAEDVAKYGDPLYDPRHDSLALIVGREEAYNHAVADLPRRRGRIYTS